MEKIHLILVTILILFLFDISGKNDNRTIIKRQLILITLLIFQFDILGKDDN